MVIDELVSPAHDVGGHSVLLQQLATVVWVEFDESFKERETETLLC